MERLVNYYKVSCVDWVLFNGPHFESFLGDVDSIKSRTFYHNQEPSMYLLLPTYEDK